MSLETDARLHKYLNMVSDLQMEVNALKKQMKADTITFMAEQERADIAEARVSAVKELMIEWMGSVEYSDIERARRLRVALATMPQSTCKTQSTFISKEQEATKP